MNDFFSDFKFVLPDLDDVSSLANAWTNLRSGLTSTA